MRDGKAGGSPPGLGNGSIVILQAPTMVPEPLWGPAFAADVVTTVAASSPATATAPTVRVVKRFIVDPLDCSRPALSGAAMASRCRCGPSHRFRQIPGSQAGGSTAWDRDRVLVGRAEETQRLVGLVDAVASGSSSALLVVGDPGIGKSAVLRSVDPVAAARGVRVIRVSASESESAVPGALLEVLRGRFADGTVGPGSPPCACSTTWSRPRRRARCWS